VCEESELPVDPVRVDTILENPHPLINARTLPVVVVVVVAAAAAARGINCRVVNVKRLTLTHLTLESVDSRSRSYDATDGMPGLPRSILDPPGALSFTATTRSDATAAGLESGRDGEQERRRERQTEETRSVSVSFSCATCTTRAAEYERTESTKAPRHEDGIPPACTVVAAPTSGRSFFQSVSHTHALLAVSRCRRLRPTTRVDRSVADVMRAVHRPSDRRINDERTDG